VPCLVVARIVHYAFEPASRLRSRRSVARAGECAYLRRGQPGSPPKTRPPVGQQLHRRRDEPHVPVKKKHRSLTSFQNKCSSSLRQVRGGPNSIGRRIGTNPNLSATVYLIHRTEVLEIPTATGRRVDQGAGICMAGRAENPTGRALLHHFAALHHDHIVANLCGHP
jgi:hypothetical protein